MSELTSDQQLLLQPCDIFLTRGTSFVSRAIRIFTRRFGEARTEVNHVGIVVEPGTVHSAMIVEALSKVKFHALGRYGSKRGTGVAVFRPVNLTPAEQALIVDQAKRYVGRKYGVAKIAAHLADWALQGAYVFRRLARMDDYPICSWVVAHAFLAAEKDFGVDARAASPDDIWDFVVANPDKYEQVRGLVPIPETLPPVSIAPGAPLPGTAERDVG